MPDLFYWEMWVHVNHIPQVGIFSPFLVFYDEHPICYI